MTDAQQRYEAECAAYRAGLPRLRYQWRHMEESALNRILANMMPDPPEDTSDEEEEDNE